jgi:hypothetical protein
MCIRSPKSALRIAQRSPVAPVTASLAASRRAAAQRRPTLVSRECTHTPFHASDGQARDLAAFWLRVSLRRETRGLRLTWKGGDPLRKDGQCNSAPSRAVQLALSASMPCLQATLERLGPASGTLRIASPVLSLGRSVREVNDVRIRPAGGLVSRRGLGRL